MSQKRKYDDNEEVDLFTFMKDETTEFLEKIENLCPNIYNVIKTQLGVKLDTNNLTAKNIGDMNQLILFLFPTFDTLRHLNELMELKGLSISDEDKENLCPILKQFIEINRNCEPLLK